MFARNGQAWPQQAYVKASNTDAGDAFGTSVALSSDGNTLAVGAQGEASATTAVNGNQADNSAGSAGAAYVFVRAGTTWSQQAYVKASNTDAGDELGKQVALSGDGNTLVVSALAEASGATGLDGNQADNTHGRAGAAYVYERAGAAWSQSAYLKASNTGATDEFGMFARITPDGAAIAISAPLEDSAATGIDGNQADNSAFAAGAVYVRP